MTPIIEQPVSHKIDSTDSSVGYIRAAQWIVVAHLTHKVVLPLLCKFFAVQGSQDSPIYLQIYRIGSLTASMVGYSDIFFEETSENLKLAYLIFIDFLASLYQMIRNYIQHKRNPCPAYLTDLSEEFSYINQNEQYVQDARIDLIIKALESPSPSNVMIVAKSGSGKSSLMSALAKRLEDPSLEKSTLYKNKVYSLDPNHFMTQTNYLGQLEEKIQSLISFAKKNPKAIIFIDEIHLISNLGATGGSPVNIAERFKDFLSNNTKNSCSYFIGATTPTEYDKMMVDPAFKRRFTQVNLPEMEPNDCKKVLRSAGAKVCPTASFSDSFLDLMIYVSSIFNPAIAQPEKALQLLNKGVLSHSTGTDLLGMSHEELTCKQSELKKIFSNFYYSSRPQNSLGVTLDQQTIQNQVDNAVYAFIAKDAIPFPVEIPDFLTNLSKQPHLHSEMILPSFEDSQKQVLQILSSPLMPNIILAGKSGVGKTFLIKSLASHLNRHSMSATSLTQKEIYQLDLTQFMANTKYQGQFHEKIFALKQFAEANKKAVIFIDEIHQVLAQNPVQRESFSIGELLKPILGEVGPDGTPLMRIIGATTSFEYTACIIDQAIRRRFKLITLKEISSTDCAKLLEQIARKKFPDISVHFSFLQLLVYISSAFNPDIAQPSKALELFDYVFVDHADQKELFAYKFNEHYPLDQKRQLINIFHQFYEQRLSKNVDPSLEELINNFIKNDPC